jgi:hypothetical protein
MNVALRLIGSAMQLIDLFTWLKTRRRARFESVFRWKGPETGSERMIKLGRSHSSLKHSLFEDVGNFFALVF